MFKKTEYIGWQFVIGQKVIDYLNDSKFGFSYIYTIETIIEDQLVIVWIEDGEKIQTKYSFEDVKTYFEDGSWVLTNLL